MRRKLNCVVSLSISSLLLAGLASNALAQAAPATQTPEGTIIGSLRGAHRLLVHADHDYQGHRDKAADEVKEALRDLGYHHKKAEPSTIPNGGTAVSPKPAQTDQPKANEPQPNSDAQMGEAEKLLQRALTLLKKQPSTTRNERATAKTTKAITEVETALAIR